MTIAQEIFDRTVAERNGKQEALAILAAASDPKGTRTRIEELTQATQDANAARDLAEKAQSDADARLLEADKREQELAERIEAAQRWIDRSTADVRRENGNVAGRQAELEKREAELQGRSDRLDVSRRNLRNVAEQVRGWLAAVDELK
jgi:hypothetical protein